MESGLQALFDNVDVLLWTVREDDEARIYFERVNPAFAELVGHSPAYYNGKAVDDISTPEEFEVIKKSLEWAKLGKVHTYEQTVEGVAGRRHLLVRIVPLVARRGVIHGFVASAVDITGRKLVERERDRHMRITRALYDLARAISTSPDVKTIMERSAVLLADNEHVEAGALYVLDQPSRDFVLYSAFGPKAWFYEGLPAFGFTSARLGEVVGAPGLVIVEEFDGRKKVLGRRKGVMVSAAMRSGSEVQGVVSMILANDVVDSCTRGFLETVASELGRSVKRKRAEQALVESEEHYRLFTDEALVGVYIFSKDRFHFVNHEMEEITGYSHEELLSLDPWTMLAAGEKEKILAPRPQGKTDLAAPFEYNMRVKRKNGEQAVLEIRTREIPFQGKTAYLGNCIDITERIHGEEREKKYLESLEFLSKTAMEFVELAPEEDIYRFIGEHLKELCGGALVNISSFDPEKGELTVRAALGTRKMIQTALKTLGKALVGSAFKINKDGREGLATGRLEHVQGGLYELVFREIPRAVCRSFEELFGLGDIYAIGFSRQKELFGAASIILPRGIVLRDPGVIEAFVKQSAVALQRRLAEEALHRSYEEMERRVRERTAELSSANEELKREIADRLKVSGALAESEERYRRVNQSIQDVIFSLDPEGRVLFISGACEKIFGTPPETLIGKNVFDAAAAVSVSRERMEEVVESYRESLERGEENLKYDFAIERDGECRFLEINERVVYGEDGKVVNSYGVVRDITDRRRVQDALAESEERYRAFTEEALVGVYIYDKKRRLLFVNPAMEKITGYSREELIQMNTRQLEVPDALKTDEMREEIFQQEDPDVHRYFMHLVRKDGSIAVLEIQTRSIVYQGWDAVLGNCIDITERRRAEEALKESEEKYRTLVERSHDGIAVIQYEKVVYLNRRLAEIGNYSVDEVQGKRFTDFIHPDELARVERYYRLRQEGGEVPAKYETDLLAKDGGKIEVDVNATVIGYQGRPAEFVVVRDITERKRAEQALVESEERFRQLAETIHEAFWLTDWKTRRVLYMSPAYEEIWGSSCRSVYEDSRSWAYSIHPDDRQRVEEAFDTRTEQGDYDEIYRIVRDDGEMRWIHDRAFPIRDEQGRVWRVAGISEDITKLKLAEQAVRESELRYRLLAENVSDVILTMDMDMEFTYISPSVARVLGYSVAETMGLGLEKIVTPASLETAREIFAEELDMEEMAEKDAKRARTMELEVLRKEGARIWLEVRATFLRDEDSQPVGILGVGRDITERKRAEKALRESHERFLTVLESLDSGVYVADMETCEILFANRKMVSNFGDIEGRICWKVLQQDQNGPCDFCTNGKLLDAEGEPLSVYSWEFRNTINGFWCEIRDRAIRWVDGRMARLEIAMDISERKRMEEELRKAHDELELRVRERTQELAESEERYRILTEEAMVGVYISRGTRFLFANPAMEKITGYTRDELLAMDNHGLILSEDLEMIRERKKKRKPGEADQYSFRIRRKGGGISTIEVRTRPVVFQGETVYMGNCVDVTELLRQRRQIEQAKLAWESTFDSIVDLVMILDPEERIMRANRAVSDYTGTELERLLGKRYGQVFHLDDSSAQVIIEGTSGTKILEHFEITDPQTKRVFSISVSPLFDQLGEPVAIVHVARDITGMREVEQALATSEAQFRALAESARDIIFSIDSQGKIAYVNPALEEILGMNSHQAVGMDIMKMVKVLKIPPSIKEILYERLGSGLPGESIPFFELEMEDEYGYKHVMEVSARRLENQVVGIARDITDRKRMQNQLIQTSKLASLGTLAVGIAHQVNNPLAIMLSTSTVLHDLVSEEQDVPEEFRQEINRYLDMMETQVERTKSVVTALLEFAHPKQSEIHAVNVNQVIEEALGFISQHLSLDKISLDVCLEPGIPDVLADPVSLQQVFINVIQNAYDALEAEGAIQIETRLKTDHIRITINDDGPGVPRAIREEIFEPLFTTKTSKGTGLGLPVSIMLLERFSARIYLEDKEDNGARFVIELPVGRKEKDE